MLDHYNPKGCRTTLKVAELCKTSYRGSQLFTNSNSNSISNCNSNSFWLEPSFVTKARTRTKAVTLTLTLTR